MATTTISMPIGLTTADGGVNANYKATVLPNSDVPALLGLNCMQQSKAILDLRGDKLHMWIANNLDDLEITVRPGREMTATKMPMVKPPSGHLILKCTDFQHHNILRKQVLSPYSTEMGQGQCWWCPRASTSITEHAGKGWLVEGDRLLLYVSRPPPPGTCGQSWPLTQMNPCFSLPK